MLRSFGKSLVVVVACAASGCSVSSCHDCIDETVSGCCNQIEAKMAWRRNKHCFCEVEYYCDFREGFIAGYLHVMNGGGCCRPTLPPRNYWSRGDSCQVVAWYNGWDAGVAQAHQDGVGGGSVITAGDIYPNHPYPVELPPDLRRDDEEGGLFPAGQGTLPDDGLIPPGSEDLPLPGENPPRIQPPYNPPAKPIGDAKLDVGRSIQKVDGRVFLDDSLTPPPPPRSDEKN